MKFKFFKCSECNNIFNNSAGLSNHKLTLHNQTELSCCFCDETFKSIQGIQEHTQHKHSNNKKQEPLTEATGQNVQKKRAYEIGLHKCKVCDFKAPYTTDVWKHAKSEHSNELPDYIFSQPSEADLVASFSVEQNCEIMNEIDDSKKTLLKAFKDKHSTVVKYPVALTNVMTKVRKHFHKLMNNQKHFESIVRKKAHQKEDIPLEELTPESTKARKYSCAPQPEA